ncbi:MAG: hypothetical protein L0332_04320 [Chloroflexi bacterium]|nr:hypothetical protein [Chloroflexota bacterium]MCI0648245.1 hypothetical protein [Chloroflexota bacterium]MCI0725935.1 hypothetical protein [Chloroflexota bacterium]
MTDAPPGLIYRAEDGIWRVGSNSSASRISDKPDAVISPDGGQVLYIQNDDIFVADLRTGLKRNITHTASRSECCPEWWPGQDGIIVFGSWPEEYEPFHSPFGDFDYGFLTRARTDGSDYKVLDESEGFYNWLAPRPYASLLIYGDRIYENSTGSRPFSGADFSLVPSENTPLREYVSARAWSPNGEFLAAYVYRRIESDPNLNEGVALFDFAARTVRYVHNYRVFGTDVQPPLPAWSHDGSMIAFYARDDHDPAKGLWVIEIETGQVLFSPTQNWPLECRGNIVWSPANNQIACTTHNREETTYWLIGLQNGEAMRFELKEGAGLLDWR